MNTAVTSKEEILRASRVLIHQRGWQAVNIRSVASACRVSVGSIYNYFESKAALTEAIVESVWREIFHRSEDDPIWQDTQACIRWVYERMALGCRQYPGLFTLHAVSFLQEDRPAGRRRMGQVWQHISDELCAVLKRDTRIRPDAFTEQFTAEAAADMLFSLMLSALLRQDFEPAGVLEFIRRALY